MRKNFLKVFENNLEKSPLSYYDIVELQSRHANARGRLSITQLYYRHHNSSGRSAHVVTLGQFCISQLYFRLFGLPRLSSSDLAQ